jgi:cobalamin synthase
VSQFVRSIVEKSFPQANAEALATGVWALVHGLAFLHLDGKLDASTPLVVAARVSATIKVMLMTTGRS